MRGRGIGTGKFDLYCAQPSFSLFSRLHHLLRSAVRPISSHSSRLSSGTDITYLPVVELPFNEPMPEEETAGLRGKVFDDNRRLRLGKNGKISGRIDVDRVHLWGFPSVFGAFVGIHGC